MAKSKQGNIMLYTGTAAVVAKALSDDQIPTEKIVTVFYDNTDSQVVAFVKIL